MATLPPVPSAKRQRLNEAAASARISALASAGRLNPSTESVVIQLQSSVDGEPLGPAISLPAASTGQRELQMIVNQLRREARGTRKRREAKGFESDGEEEDEDDEEEEDVPFAFHLDVAASAGQGAETMTEGEVAPQQPTRLDISTSIAQDVLQAALTKKLDLSAEDTLRIVFEPQAVFKVRPVRRCSSTLSGEWPRRAPAVTFSCTYSKTDTVSTPSPSHLQFAPLGSAP